MVARARKSKPEPKLAAKSAAGQSAAKPAVKPAKPKKAKATKKPGADPGAKPVPESAAESVPRSTPKPALKAAEAHVSMEPEVAREYSVRALVLQGGGALGAYQGGVLQGLAEGGIDINWVAGISIGALNAAVIAGNPPETRVTRLREFWETICQQPWLPSLPHALLADSAESWPEPVRIWFDAMHAARAMFEGQRGFFIPRPWPEFFGRYTNPGQVSFYDTGPLKATLEAFADFDRINDHKAMRVSVGAVNVRTGNFEYFDNTRGTLRPEHFMASGALPPGFPAIEIDGEFYWDGGLVSNTPLAEVLAAQPRRDALIFQVDLWSARGHLPHDLSDVAERQKDIQYSSRTRAITDVMREQQNYRRILSQLMQLVPESEHDNHWYKRAEEHACDARRNVIQLIYRDKSFENSAKDYQFGALTMAEHWSSGLDDIRQTLKHPQWLAMPGDEHPFVTHDVHRGNGDRER